MFQWDKFECHLANIASSVESMWMDIRKHSSSKSNGNNEQHKKEPTLLMYVASERNVLYAVHTVH